MSRPRDYGLSLVDDDFDSPGLGAGSVPGLGLGLADGFFPRPVAEVRCICFGLRRHKPDCACDCHFDFSSEFDRYRAAKLRNMRDSAARFLSA